MNKITLDLINIDDEYLVGISNKGIVKRSHKDLEKTAVSLEYDMEISAIQGKIDDITTKIVFPLSESECSCPSKNICKHIVMTILAAQREHKLETKPAQQGNQNELQQKFHNNPNMNNNNQLKTELQNFPLKKIIMAIKEKSYNEVLKNYSLGKIKITGQSVLKVELPGEKWVKLLSPLEHSNCSCKSKEFCTHKAKAILCGKLFSGVQLEPVISSVDNSGYNILEMREILEKLLKYIAELVGTGIVRSKSEVSGELMRMAIKCHKVHLYDIEKMLRQLSGLYAEYENRSLAVNGGLFIDTFNKIYNTAKDLLEEENTTRIIELAGKSKETYEFCGELNFLGIAEQAFNSKKGYRGLTTYLYEVNKRKWFTYTSVKPTIYENEDDNNQSSYIQYSALSYQTSNAQKPISFQKNLINKMVKLEKAKADRRGRISIPESEKPEVKTEFFRYYSKALLKKVYFSDFTRLYEYISQCDYHQSLVFIEPKEKLNGELNRRTQRYTQYIQDSRDREVIIDILNNSINKTIISQIKIVTNEADIVFFGRAYLSQGRIHLIPIKVFRAKNFV